MAQWFDAHSKADLERARSLIADDAPISVLGGTLHGFDEFMEWYQRHVMAEPAFSHEIVDLVGGEDHAAAVLVLRSEDRSWRQLVVRDPGWVD